MIGFVKDIINSGSNNIISFTNLDLVDTGIIFEEIRKKIDFFIPEFIRYITGDKRKSKIYGTIRKYYTEEIMYMNDNVFDNIDLRNLDIIIEDSCAIYKDLRVVVLDEKINLSSITGYDIISYTRNDYTIHTIFIEDTKIDTKTAISICLKLFDRIMVSTLYKYNIPVNNSKIISLVYDGSNGFKVSKFIYDYFYELLYPFTGKIITEEKDLPNIVFQLSRANFEILSEDQLVELYNYIKNKYNDEDKYGYIELVAQYQQVLEGKNLFNTDN